VDILIVGGGMAACGAAFEVKKWMQPNQTVLLVDKAALEPLRRPWPRVSRPSTPTSAENSPDDYVRMVRNDLMGLVAKT